MHLISTQAPFGPDAANELASDVTDAVQGLLGLDPQAQGKLLLSLLVILLIWVARVLLLRMVERRLPDQRSRYQWAKTSGYVAFVLVLLFLTQIWLEAVGEMGTFLGLLTAGLAIALRDLVTNMAGWAFILLRHPFVVGDRIQVGEHRGDVVDIRLFQFTLFEIGNWVDADQSTGRIIHVPNARVFSDPLANYTADFGWVWHEIPVLVTFESNWQRAKELLQEVVERHAGALRLEAEADVRKSSRKFLIQYGTLTPKVYTEVRDSGVLLTLRFICPVRKRRGLAEDIWESTLTAFAEAGDVGLAYPTRRLFMNPLEGKPDARAPLPRGTGLEGSGAASKPNPPG